MKRLRSKKTGEIGYLVVGKGSDRYTVTNDEWDNCGKYNSLAELTEEWEDYEEPKEYWCIDWDGDVSPSDIHDLRTKQMKLIGNYFETKEEAEKAVEKLKAWKRLKDKGFRTYDICKSPTGFVIHFEVDWEHRGVMEDLDTCFGGEE